MTEINVNYNTIISLENLYEAWREFVRDKTKRKDVAEFSLNLSGNLFRLYEDLRSKAYRHGGYEAFAINDPKPRSIHKATVRDRLLHHAVYRVLYPYFDKKFIYDSYSCRYGKGTHRANNRFRHFFNRVSRNDYRTCWVLKCDVKKFFASIDHVMLMEIFKRHVVDEEIIWLIGNIVDSFQTTSKGKGLPLGNLTSQLLVNVYMNECDQWLKHVKKIKHYIRYADDFVLMHPDRIFLEHMIPEISNFLDTRLKLSLHPDKLYIKTFASGVDFLGWVHFPTHRTLRTSTKRRMFKKLEIAKENKNVVQSYLGLLKHGNTQQLKKNSLFTMDEDYIKTPASVPDCSPQ